MARSLPDPRRPQSLPPPLSQCHRQLQTGFLTGKGGLVHPLITIFPPWAKSDNFLFSPQVLPREKVGWFCLPYPPTRCSFVPQIFIPPTPPCSSPVTGKVAIKFPWAGFGRLISFRSTRPLHKERFPPRGKDCPPRPPLPFLTPPSSYMASPEVKTCRLQTPFSPLFTRNFVVSQRRLDLIKRRHPPDSPSGGSLTVPLPPP